MKKKHGIQKYYYESGRLKAVTDFYEGRPGTLLEEYQPDGKKIQYGLNIMSKEVDRLAFEGNYIYLFKLNKPSDDNRFYMGELDQGRYFPISYYTLKKKDQYFIKDFFVPKYAFFMDKMNIFAVTKTKFGNELILVKKINIAINNFN